MVFFPVGLFHNDPEIQKPLVQLFRNLFRIAAGNMVMQSRVLLPAKADYAGKITNLERFGTSEINVAAQNIIYGFKLFRNFIRHGKQVFCMLAKQHPLLCQFDGKAVADEQFLPQFFFQPL